MSGSACIRLSYVDSNHDRQNQKLQCYHYTIRQSLAAKAEALNHATKLLTKSRTTKFFRVFNGTGAVAEIRFYIISVMYVVACLCHASKLLRINCFVVSCLSRSKCTRLLFVGDADSECQGV